MAATAKALPRKLTANKARLNRLLTELKELCIDAVDKDVLVVQLELTEALFRETDALQDLEVKEQNGAIEDWSKSRRLFVQLKARACALLRQNDKPSCCDGGDTPNTRQAAAPTRIGKLPELTLPQFDGEILEFPKQNVHGRTELDAASKFAYLLSSTVGRARSAITGIPATAAHYPHAVEILEKRFSRPKMVAREHFLALWKAPACREMVRQCIQSLVDEFTKHFRCLTAMGKDPHVGELPMSEARSEPGLKEKFPRALHGGLGPEDSLFPTGDLGLEESGRGKSSGATQNDSRRLKGRERDRVRSSAAALVTFVQCVCPFCEGDHDATSCKRFLDADHESRASLLREKGVCYKSLKTGHLARECRKGRQCRVDGCRQAHHQLLHPPAAKESDRSHQGLLVTRSTLSGCIQIARARAYGRTKSRSGELHFRHGSRGLFHQEGRRRDRPWEAVWGRSADGGESSFDLELLRAQTDQMPDEHTDGALAGTDSERRQRQGASLVIDVLIGIDYYYEFMTGRVRRTTGG
ncbi:hypothetical protein T4C_11799 [Trichinella pseudospiralis]|uniref:CCHC-type domain-containing protein n=1 Tax=Trichinella pseudospiralis TaxID=6337 RepID=A0A0V1K2T5_TRIPS|nr:hypothetical protein T4C_10712 [Trichinella pseudospiralis]KRZ41530.1 hypothetical protein T4C_11799 [Trichinella pseudospiralis]